MKKTVVRSFVMLVVAGSFGLGLAGCSGGSSAPDTASDAGGSAVSNADAGTSSDEGSGGVEAGSVIIDVRTAEEFSEGHLDGATNLDLNSGQFQEAISGLDPDVNYVLYCRSGNRSGQAAALLKSAGFENVVDLGSLQDASSETGISIVQ